MNANKLLRFEFSALPPLKRLPQVALLRWSSDDSKFWMHFPGDSERSPNRSALTQKPVRLDLIDSSFLRVQQAVFARG